MTAKKKKKPASQDPSEQVQAPQADAPDPAAERDDLMARLQRVSADYLNYQKRMQRDMDEAVRLANAGLIESLLPILDDMERALEAAENHGAGDTLFDGLKLVHNKAMEILGRFGLRLIEAQGKTFDPQKHRAMMQQPCDEHPPQTVLQVMQKGYELGGRTIRPASVMVSCQNEPDQADKEEEQEDADV